MGIEEVDLIKKELASLLGAKDIDYRKVMKLASELSKFDENYQRFFIDAKTILHLGRDSRAIDFKF